MTAAVAAQSAVAPIDPRLAAFLSPECPEVFHSVATPTTIWMSDPYDVEGIHSDARAAFEHLIYRGNFPSPAPSGAVLVLLGEAGSGKTHLMRAFRTRAHRQGLAYCGYLQMTAEATHYARYVLTNLIESLERSYSPDGDSRTALSRLSRALLEAVPALSSSDRDAFRDGDVDSARLVDEYADRLQQMSRFHNCDLELMRVLLHLERNEPQVRSRALMWLRCQEMRPQDRAWIGDAIARTDDADPLNMLKNLARLMYAVHGVPLVLLVDQLEDMANQSAPVERFLKVVDTITALTDSCGNVVVVMACLEDYFRECLRFLNRAKQDRLMRDPEPIRLLGNRTLAEIREMTARRLEYIYNSEAVDFDPAQDLYPFRESHLIALNNFRTRDVLDYLRQHHQQCLLAGRWIEPGAPVEPAAAGEPAVDSVAAADCPWDALWNDFHAAHQAQVPDSETALAQILVSAIQAASAELPEGFHFDCTGLAAQRYLEVETCKPNDDVEKLVVAVCNATTRGVAFGRQLSELEERAGEIPVAIVRTTDFPKAGKAATQVAGMLRRQGRTVVVSDSDWRRMLAFQGFLERHADRRAELLAWQKQARPLGELDSLQKILRLNSLHAPPRAAAAPCPVEPVAPARVDVEAPAAPSESPGPDMPLVFGSTLSLDASPVTFTPQDFVQHAAFLGGTGSGKTTAALNLIEQLLARGIPAVLVDRKGDLCRYADPRAWDRPLESDAFRSRRQELHERLDVAVFTPGDPQGRSLALPLVPPEFSELPESDRERLAQYTAAALGSMIGFKASDVDRGQKAILAKALETLTAARGPQISLGSLRELIKNQDDSLLNAIGGAYPSKYFDGLAQRLLTLELNNRQLLQGEEQLDVESLLGLGPHARGGRVRLSIISTRFLGDAAKVDFWVSQLLIAVSRWCARSPQPRLQAVFLFDEADVYLPAGNRQPATKAPMEDLLKRARSAGVGIFLATQSPGDFDYKCRENVGTWVLGRVREARALEKLKPMLSAGRGNVLERLAGQTTGEFQLVREGSVQAVRSDASLIRTDQLSESEILELARRE